MATYYVDPAASGANDGTSWTDAWETLQRAVDGITGNGATIPTAGDTVYCRGTEVLAATVDFDQGEGSAAGGYVKWIGCNAGGSIDGTRFCLNGNSAVVNCVLCAEKDWIWFENIEMKNATGDGWDATDAFWNNWVFINCTSHDNGGAGWDVYYNLAEQPGQFIRCQAYNNSAEGWDNPYGSANWYFCEAKDNGATGFETPGTAYGTILLGCISHNNGGDGVESLKSVTVAHCVIDENDDEGLDIGTQPVIVVGCRITDNGKDTTGYGIDQAAGSRCLYGWNFLIDNDSGVTNGNVDAIPYNGTANTNETAGTEGYTDGANDDFNLTAAADLRSDPIELN